ncbi:HAD-IIIC family phosphatase [Candidatus Pelagibacter sp. HIMB1695]|uniref:HAD-IIIC family phosphatase n=1 Tax=Candidatus Pelagibacter sp. HIMB1695 TaxID=3413364 RepID=UPI003F869B5C
MHKNLYENLEWYPEAPNDFDEKLKKIFSKKINYQELNKLIKCRLNTLNVIKIFNKFKKIEDFELKKNNLKQINLGIISNHTSSHLIPNLVVSGLRHGLVINIFEAPYDQLAQIALGDLNPFENLNLDFILLAIDVKGYSILRQGKNFFDKNNDETDSIKYLNEIREKLNNKFKAPCICQTLPQQPELYFGNIESSILGTDRNFINQFNTTLINNLKNSSDYIFDVSALSEIVGTNSWHDQTMHYHAKLPFAQKYVPLYTEHLSRIIATISGKTKKVLVIDLDNTIWGGVIGDDGLNGIKLGKNDKIGEIYLDIQKMILTLRDRGIVIAVCSKNDEKIAKEVFKNHRDMILKEDHITVFKANWKDKPSNIIEISNSLNLSLDSFVFLDDNPMERDIVRQHIPEVAVPELTNDPETYVRTLLAGGYFETIVFSEEDTKRVDSYNANIKRSNLLSISKDIGSYLKTLKMKAEIKQFQENDLSRITQLILRSNQFNLTTKRYKLSEIKDIMQSGTYSTFQIRLEDIFGDNGLISLIICKKVDDIWEIDTWIMSCRVLGRKVEEFSLNHLRKVANLKNIKKIKGIYRNSGKNDLVKDHYKKLGFSNLNIDEELNSEWIIDVNKLDNYDLVISPK